MQNVLQSRDENENETKLRGGHLICEFNTIKP